MVIRTTSGSASSRRSRNVNELALGGTILLVIDDLHAADQPTLLLLRHVLRGTEDGTLGIVGMFIDTEVPPAHRLRAMLADFRAVHPVATVHLQGLHSQAVEELVQGLAENAPADLVPQLCRLTDGNPLFLDELLRQVGYREAEQSEEDAAPVPPALSPTEAIRELVEHDTCGGLPEDVIYLLQAAAVAGPESEAGVVAEAAELTAEQRLDAFDRAEESRLLRRVGQDIPRPLRLHPTRWCATPSTANCCVDAGSATTTRSRSPRSGPTPATWTPTSTSWPITSTWARPWPMPKRPATTARPPGSSRSACWPSRRRRSTSPAASRWPSSTGSATRGRAATRSSRWQRRRTGPATRRWPMTTSCGRRRWRATLGDAERLAATRRYAPGR